MKEIEWKVLSELMKNSRRSDRELAKVTGSSQPTVSRIRKRLEKEGYVREYTMIPEFTRLGFELLAVTFITLKKALSQEEFEEAKKLSLTLARKSSEKGPFEVIMAERGIGMGYSGVFISLHEDYSSYAKLRDWLRQFQWLDPSAIQSFLINLKDEFRYLPLTFSNLANYLTNLKDKK